MSAPAQNTSLSLPARLFCYLGPPSAILLTSIASPRTGLFSPLAFAPTALLFERWRRSNTAHPSRHAELEPMIWTYAATGTIGLASIALLQMVVCTAVTRLLFPSASSRKYFWDEFQRATISGLTGDQIALRAQVASSSQNWVFNGLLSFVAAGFIEEALKYLPIAFAQYRAKKAEQGERRDRAYIDYALAGALSFGVVENIAFLYASCEHGHESWPKFVLTLFERVIFGASGHLLVSALTALRATRRDYYGERLSWWSVIWPAVMLHGAFDFVALSFSALEGNVGWIHPTDLKNTGMMFGLLAGLISTAAWQVRQNFKRLDELDRKR